MKLKRKCPNCNEKSIKGLRMKLPPHTEICSNCGCEVRKSKISWLYAFMYIIPILFVYFKINGVINAIYIGGLSTFIFIIVDFKFVPLIIVDNNKDKLEI